MPPDSQGYSSHDKFLLGYVTDVEGNTDYFLRYVDQSNVLTVQEEMSTAQTLILDLLGTNTYFVYGGDAVDKGPGDIRLVRALVDLKKRYPERVYLLVGNRDLNKLRLTAELADDDMQREISSIPPPHWDPTAPTLEQYLKQKQLQEQQEMNATKSLEHLNTRVNRLKYLLDHTLGCPNTFRFRREELSVLLGVNKSTITDEQVLESFLYEVEDPNGSLRQYMECANVAVVIGNTLFCHGAVDCNTMKYIPRDDTKFENPISKPPAGEIVENLRAWVRALNKYLERGLEDYRSRPYWNADRSSRGGDTLMALQNRPAVWGRSIVSNSYGDGGCITSDHATQIRTDPERIAQEIDNPLVFEKVSSDPLDTSVADWLLQNEIQRVVVGHKPTGDCPAVLSATYHGVEIVSADTSFSDTRADDNRGAAIGIVEVFGESSTDNQLELRGLLRNGEAYVSKFLRLHDAGKVDTCTGDAMLGLRIQHDNLDYWIKAAKADGAHYWLTRGHGRHVEYKTVDKGAIQKELILK